MNLSPWLNCFETLDPGFHLCGPFHFYIIETLFKSGSEHIYQHDVSGRYF